MPKPNDSFIIQDINSFASVDLLGEHVLIADLPLQHLLAGADGTGLLARALHDRAEPAGAHLGCERSVKIKSLETTKINQN